jgi:hypothetical protein
LAVCPAAVAPVARALHVRMPMQNGGGRDDIDQAGVRLRARKLFSDGLGESPTVIVPCPALALVHSRG